MAFQLTRIVTKSDKGQRTETVQSQTTRQTGLTTTTTNAREDSQTAKQTVKMTISFALKLRGGQPQTPVGEVETNTGC